MTKRINVLLIEDREEDSELILYELRQGGFDPHPERIMDCHQLRNAIHRGSWDIILCDYTLPEFDAPSALAILQETGCDVPLIVITGTIGEDHAAEIMRLGASDFILKHRLNRLVSAVQRSLATAKMSRDAKQAQQANAVTRRELETLVERAPMAICVIDSACLVRRWNPAAERLFGIAKGDIVGRPFPLPTEESARLKFTAMLEQARLGDVATTVELRLRHNDGKDVIAEVSIAPLAEPDILILLQDITDRKHLQQMLHQAQKLESIGQLAAGIAHEINTPMQFIGDNTKFLIEGFRNLRITLDAWRSSSLNVAEVETIEQQEDLAWLLGEIPTSLEHLQDGINRVVEIVRAMKDFSHPGHIEATPQDLNRAIQATLTISRSMWKYVAEIELDLDPELPEVPVALGGFNQAVLNLVINAAQAIEDASLRNGSAMGKITVRSRRQGDFAIIEVSDTGCGMTPGIQSSLFQPFFTTKGVGRGTGQGLTILRAEIIDRLGGDITVESTSGIGSTFRLHIPLRHRPVESAS